MIGRKKIKKGRKESIKSDNKRERHEKKRWKKIVKKKEEEGRESE